MIRHVDEQTPCPALAAHKPCFEDGHWCACLDTEVFPLSAAKLDAFRSRLSKLVASLPQEQGEKGQVFSTAAVNIRCDGASPYRAAQTLTLALSEAGFYKMEWTLQPKEGQAVGSVKGRAVAEPVSAPPSAPTKLTVALVFHRDTGLFERELRVPVGIGPEGDRLLEHLFAALAGRLTGRLSCAGEVIVTLDICPEAPWSEVCDLIEVAKRAGFEKIEFPPRGK